MSTTAPALRWSRAPAAQPGFRLIDRLHRNPASERASLLAALLQPRASIPPKYFYDELGCKLFEAICTLPEYYPTRTERAILSDNAVDIARYTGTRRQVVDLGAGDCAKAELLLPVLRPRRYIAVDIAAEALNPALARLSAAYEDIDVMGLVTDFSSRIDFGGVLDSTPTTFFYPGSSIGNFTRSEAISFLSQLRALATPASGLLIGVDTKKPVDRLIAAYDDPLGVTGAFNRNVLNHVNRVLPGNFDPNAFSHVALYNEREGRIEMHLESLLEQRVQLGGRQRLFRQGERIHTENSHKYSLAEFAAVLQSAGFNPVREWSGANGDFVVFYAELA